MVRRAATLAAIPLVLGLVHAQEPAVARPSTPSARELLDRAADYVSRFVNDFSNVVAQEDYRQDWQSGERRRLTSDFLLVRYPGRDRSWLAFRDVTAVNGRTVGDQQDRLMKLFMDPFDDAVRRAEEITLEASRHSLVELGVFSNPFVVLAWLQPYYQPDFIYRLGDLEMEGGVPLRQLTLQEIVKPVPSPTPVRRPAVAAAAWIDERTGRVVKTEARIGIAPNTGTSTTTFRFDETLGIDVPAEMKESRVGRNRTGRGAVIDQFTGIASYSRFRRFAVRTDEQIEKPGILSPR